MITIIIPCYNEKEIIKDFIDELYLNVTKYFITSIASSFSVRSLSSRSCMSSRVSLLSPRGSTFDMVFFSLFSFFRFVVFYDLILLLLPCLVHALDYYTTAPSKLPSFPNTAHRAAVTRTCRLILPPAVCSYILIYCSLHQSSIFDSFQYSTEAILRFGIKSLHLC